MNWRNRQGDLEQQVQGISNMNDQIQMEGQKHWDKVYSGRASEELGWYQETPEISLAMIQSLYLDRDSHIIDIGAGDSSLISRLLYQGFTCLSLLDISEKALERTRSRMGDQSERVRMIHSNVLDLDSGAKYDLWHDRACFHFMTSDDDRQRYLKKARESIKPQGYLLVGAFSTEGPERCSGLPVHRYDEQAMRETFTGFELRECRYLDHQTPSGNLQNYIFCLFRAKP